MSVKFVPAKFLLFTLLLLTLAGCGAGVRHHMQVGFPQGQPYRLALLPLTNLTNDPGAAEVLQSVLAIEMAGVGFVEVIDPVAVKSALSRNRIRYADRMNTEQLSALASELDVHGVLVGAVYEYGFQPGDDGQVPIVSMHARIIDLPEGQIVWAAEQTRTGTDGEFILGIGVEKSITKLAGKVAAEIVATLD